jgi:RimJ/RimL family protein N-acetyltransferase
VPPLLPIVTERLELRALRLDDAAVLFRDVYGDAEVMRWVAGGPVADLATAEAAIQRFMAHQRTRGFGWWAVVERATGRLVGDAGLYSYEDRGPGVEVGYTLARHAWGRGLATEAATASLRAAFGPLGLDRVLAVARPENAASLRVLEKAGMGRDGRTEYLGHEHVRFVAHRATWAVA